MIQVLLRAAAALLLTLCSLLVVSNNGERTMYGHEGLLNDNFLPREQAGWPAPFLVDSPDTSVLHKVGLEDDLRPFNLLASYSFWLLIVLGFFRLLRPRR
ncbi:hypothetical protein [Novosphingobium sp.]|uniref:hypothetical protein n=1 Tax=Novosphingobium sp. TaxID=1874826 RepID=UPI0025D81BCF|nr:hypothetical protein [Novosphingobium sp.]